MIMAVLVMLLVRPHIAALLLMTASAIFVLMGQGSAFVRATLVAISVPAAAYTLIGALAYVGLGDNFSAAAITEYVEQRQEYNIEGQFGIEISELSVPMRMFTYLYRPLFFDAQGLVGVAFSIENVVLLGITFIGLFAMINQRRSNLPRYTFWFMLSYVVLSWIILSNTTANLGIALRQKWMFLPMLQIIFLSYLSPLQTRKAHLAQ